MQQRYNIFLNYHSINYKTNRAILSVTYVNTAKLSILLINILFAFSLNAQTIDRSIIPNIDSCKNSLIKFYQVKTLSEQEQYKYKTSFQWLNYLPNIGWNFIINTSSITTNFNNIAQQVNSKRVINATIKGITLKNEIYLNQDILEIENLIRTIENKIALYEYEKLIYNLSYDQYTIINQQYQAKEIPPLAYITAKQAYLQNMYALKQYENAIQNNINQCIKTAKQSNWVALPAINNHK